MSATSQTFLFFLDVPPAVALFDIHLAAYLSTEMDIV